tara:strand:+ start:390 stop:539 length:150 start_codon:yes stop_codon:yes gene_type:complete
MEDDLINKLTFKKFVLNSQLRVAKDLEDKGLLLLLVGFNSVCEDVSRVD